VRKFDNYDANVSRIGLFQHDVRKRIHQYTTLHLCNIPATSAYTFNMAAVTISHYCIYRIMLLSPHVLYSLSLWCFSHF